MSTPSTRASWNPITGPNRHLPPDYAPRAWTSCSLQQRRPETSMWLPKAVGGRVTIGPGFAKLSPDPAFSLLLGSLTMHHGFPPAYRLAKTGQPPLAYERPSMWQSFLILLPSPLSPCSSTPQPLLPFNSYHHLDLFRHSTLCHHLTCGHPVSPTVITSPSTAICRHLDFLAHLASHKQTRAVPILNLMKLSSQPTS